jgi:hypothetical protein
VIAIDSARSTMITAVVRAPDGVRFTTSQHCADQVAAELVAYILRRCDDVLWPLAAAQVHALIDARASHAAIAAYFEHVGSRWDEERLEIHVSTRHDDHDTATSATAAIAARRCW